MRDHKIHLVYEPWPEAEFMGHVLPMPDFAGYGHVYCILEDDEDFATLKDIPEVAAQSVSAKRGDFGILRNLFYKALNVAALRVQTDENIIYVVDEDTNVASFRISEDDYNRARAHFMAQDGQIVPYDRLVRNCVHNAAKDLRAAGVDLGSGFGYTAGRFFKKAQAAGDGNLLYTACEIKVVERTVLNAPAPD